MTKCRQHLRGTFESHYKPSNKESVNAFYGWTKYKLVSTQKIEEHSKL